MEVIENQEKLAEYLGKYVEIEHYKFLVWPWQVIVGALIFLIGMGCGFFIAVIYNVGKIYTIRPFM